MLFTAAVLLFSIGSQAGWRPVSGEAIKTWMPNTNYWDPLNWDMKRIPCRSDRVVFPEDLSAAVALHPGATSLREMVLPLTGEVLLPKSGELTVTGQQDSLAGCQGEDVEFIGGQTHFWLDTANWNGPNGKPLFGGENSPVPHSERIPCETDQVYFLDGGTFQVQLPDVPVRVGVLNIQGQEVSKEQLEEMVLDDTGFHVFKGDASQLQITGEMCQDPRGCVCNVDLHPLTWLAICNFESPRCRPPPCETAITPRGFCCPICGASIEIEFRTSWSRMKSTIENMIEYTKEKAGYPDVLHHISRIAKNKLQIVLRDEETYFGQSVGLAQELKNQFETVEFVTTPYAKLKTSGDPITSWGSAFGIVAKTLLLALSILSVSLLINYFAKKMGGGIISVEDIQPSFLFARFENAPAEAEVEIAQQAFHNPMFNLEGNPARSMDKVTLKELEGRQQDSDSEETSSKSSEKMFNFEE